MTRVRTMSRKYALRALRAAGYKMEARLPGQFYIHRNRAGELLLRLRSFSDRPGDTYLEVYPNGRNWGSTFYCLANALAYLKRVESIQCVHSNDWALRRPARGELRLVSGGAA